MESRDYIQSMSQLGLQIQKPTRSIDTVLPISDLPDQLQEEYKGSAAGVISKSLVPQKKLLQTTRKLVAMLEENKLASDLLAKLDSMEDYNRKIEMVGRIEELERREAQVTKDQQAIIEMQKMMYQAQSLGPAESIVKQAVAEFNKVHRGNEQQVINIDEHNQVDGHIIVRIGNRSGVNFRHDVRVGYNDPPYMKDYAYKSIGTQLIMAGLQIESDKPPREFDWRMSK